MNFLRKLDEALRILEDDADTYVIAAVDIDSAIGDFVSGKKSGRAPSLRKIIEYSIYYVKSHAISPAIKVYIDETYHDLIILYAPSIEPLYLVNGVDFDPNTVSMEGPFGSTNESLTAMANENRVDDFYHYLIQKGHVD